MSPMDKEVRDDKAEQRGRLPEHPTMALPGTPEKLEVMAGRYRRKECLFHPQDAKPTVVGRPGECWYEILTGRAS